MAFSLSIDAFEVARSASFCEIWRSIAAEFRGLLCGLAGEKATMHLDQSRRGGWRWDEKLRRGQSSLTVMPSGEQRRAAHSSDRS